MGEANAYAARAMSAYRASQRLDQSPAAILAAVHEDLVRSLEQAKFAYESKALDQMCRHAGRCSQILQALVTVLRFPDAGVNGARLQQFYRQIQRDVTRFLIDENVTKKLDSAVITLREMCREFRKQ